MGDKLMAFFNGLRHTSAFQCSQPFTETSLQLHCLFMTAPAEPAYHRRVMKDGNATTLRRYGFDSKEPRSRALPVLGVTHHFMQSRASGPLGRAAGMRRDFGMKAGEGQRLLRRAKDGGQVNKMETNMFE